MKCHVRGTSFKDVIISSKTERARALLRFAVLELADARICRSTYGADRRENKESRAFVSFQLLVRCVVDPAFADYRSDSCLLSELRNVCGWIGSSVDRSSFFDRTLREPDHIWDDAPRRRSALCTSSENSGPDRRSK